MHTVRFPRLALGVASFCIAALPAASSAQSSAPDGVTAVAALGRSVVSAGAVSASTTTIRLAGTIGQPMVGVIGSSGSTASIGFWYRGGETQTGVKAAAAPAEFQVNAFPNPLNSATTLRFRLEQAGDVRIDICDALGRVARSLPAERLEPGLHDRVWDGRDASGSPLPSGYYFAVVHTSSLSGARQTGTTELKVIR